MSKTVVMVGALDTKGQEFAFAQYIIQTTRLENARTIDFGVLGEPAFKPDITR